MKYTNKQRHIKANTVRRKQRANQRLNRKRRLTVSRLTRL